MKKIVLIGLLLLAACSQQPVAELEVGAVLYLTNNDYDRVAQEFLRGLELAIQDSDKKVELIVEDDQLIERNTVTATTKLLEVDEVDVIFYSEYLQARVASPLAEEKEVPSIVIWESGPKIDEIGEYVFGTGLSQLSAGQLPATFAREELDVSKAAIIYDQNVWAENVVNLFKEEFVKLGGEIVLEEAVSNDLTDFRSVIVKAQNSDADVLFAPLGYHPGQFFKQLKEVGGVEMEVVSSDQISQEFIDAAQGGLEGAYYSNPDDTMTPELEDLQEKYEAKYGDESSDIKLVALAYDSMGFVIDSWNENEDFKTTLKTKKYSGTLGEIDLSREGGFQRPEVMYFVEDGKPVKI